MGAGASSAASAAVTAASNDELTAALGALSGDAKDSDDFEYLTYKTCPKWNHDDASSKTYHKSLMSKTVTAEVFEAMKDKKTKGAGDGKYPPYTFSNAIQTGTETPHLGVGLTCGDEESFEVFADVINPIIKGWHKG